jgi:hypothetical protein
VYTFKHGPYGIRAREAVASETKEQRLQRGLHALAAAVFPQTVSGAKDCETEHS